MGRTIEVMLPEGEMRKTYDGAGNELTRRYHGGGTVRRRADAFGMATQWEAFADPPTFTGGGATGAVAAGSPSWYQVFSYNAAGDVAEVAEPDGCTRYEHDALGRLAQRVTKAGVKEQYRHDVTGNWYPQAHREYGAGGRLSRHGDVRFTYNDAGFVIERTRTLSDGATLRTRFSWNGAGQLSAVTEPDGRWHTFAHDVFGRCLRQVTSLGGVTVSKTAFTWDGERLIREQTTHFAPDGRQLEEERSYAYEPRTIGLLGERRRQWALTPTDSSRVPSRTLTLDTGWLFHEAAHDGSVSVLLFPDGRVAESADVDPWGRLGQNHRSDTRWRRLGQYQAPAGLYYNRHRFYDPQAGVYLSPEPLGIGESLKPYAYVDNYPLRVVDVDGLKKRMTATITRKHGDPISRESGVRKENGGKYHPAVLAALPPSNAKTDDPSADPGGCAEPAVLSAYLEGWEEDHKTPPPPKSCKPGDENWRENLRSAMREVDSISSSDSEGPAAACPNCTQLIPRLARLAKTGPPKIGEGRDFSVPSRRESSGSFSTSKPSRAFLKDKSNRLARTQELTPSQAAAVQGIELGMYSRRKGV
jgi:RHS repeat-associated protein